MKITYEGADVLICPLDANQPGDDEQVHAFISCNDATDKVLNAMSRKDANLGSLRTVFGYSIYGKRQEIEPLLKAKGLNLYHGHV